MEIKKYLATTVENQFIKIHLYYSKGGMNYYHGKNERRGYYMSVIPVVRIKGEGYISEQCSPHEGVKYMVLEVARKSDKSFSQAEMLMKDHEDKLVNHVCTAQGIKLAEKEIV